MRTKKLAMAPTVYETASELFDVTETSWTRYREQIAGVLTPPMYEDEMSVQMAKSLVMRIFANMGADDGETIEYRIRFEETGEITDVLESGDGWSPLETSGRVPVPSGVRDMLQNGDPVRFEAQFRVSGGTGGVGAHTGVAIGAGVIQD